MACYLVASGRCSRLANFRARERSTDKLYGIGRGFQDLRAILSLAGSKWTPRQHKKKQNPAKTTAGSCSPVRQRLHAREALVDGAERVADDRAEDH